MIDESSGKEPLGSVVVQANGVPSAEVLGLLQTPTSDSRTMLAPSEDMLN